MHNYYPLIPPSTTIQVKPLSRVFQQIKSPMPIFYFHKSNPTLEPLHFEIRNLIKPYMEQPSDKTKEPSKHTQTTLEQAAMLKRSRQLAPIK
ncbi:hypothetical protein JTE90_026537 [Oedothorax gibbosus]|uniref:Uncharacterized protein n=1 Tax=Oedothorax gibbosus TaxID=931172 RepID=A0AAV6VT34_9ARAC|nr:hypothetical protein JTE90_026537 [Oedothorax gibbosus]